MLVADTLGLVGRDPHKTWECHFEMWKTAESCEKCARMLALMATIAGENCMGG